MKLGNKSMVDPAHIFEITPDLVVNYPKAFCINCEITLNQSKLNQLTDIDLSDLNRYFESIVDNFLFDIRCLDSRFDSNYKTSCYLVEMIESQSQLSLVDLFYRQKLATNTASEPRAEECIETVDNQEQSSQLETSNFNFRFDISENTILSTGSDDHAVAESLTVSTRFADQTINFNDTTNITGLNKTAKDKNDLLVTVSQLITNRTDMSEWNCTPADKKKYCPLIDEITLAFDESVLADKTEKNMDHNSIGLKSSCLSLLDDSVANDFSNHMHNSFSSTKNDLDVEIESSK